MRPPNSQMKHTVVPHVRNFANVSVEKDRPMKTCNTCWELQQVLHRIWRLFLKIGGRKRCHRRQANCSDLPSLVAWAARPIGARPDKQCNCCLGIPTSADLSVARSRLDRRRFLRSNMRWKALDEIYKFHILLVTLIFEFPQSFVKTFSNFSKNRQN